MTSKGKRAATHSEGSAAHKGSVVLVDSRDFTTNLGKAVAAAPRSVIFSRNLINFSEEGLKGDSAEVKAVK